MKFWIERAWRWWNEVEWVEDCESICSRDGIWLKIEVHIFREYCFMHNASCLLVSAYNAWNSKYPGPLVSPGYLEKQGFLWSLRLLGCNNIQSLSWCQLRVLRLLDSFSCPGTNIPRYLLLSGYMNIAAGYGAGIFRYSRDPAISECENIQNFYCF